MWPRAKPPTKPKTQPTGNDPDAQSPVKRAVLDAEREQTLDRLLDTLSAITRLLGRHAFDTRDCSAAEFEKICEDWNRHILLGTAAPSQATTESGGEGTDAPAALAGVPLGKRDWKGLYHFLQRHRLAEEQAVAATVSTLRNLVVDSLGTFRQLIAEDRKLDTAIGYQLEELRSSTQDQPLDVMQACILSAARAISGLLREKSRALDRQLEQMRTQIKSARQEILDMRREMEEDPLTGTHNRRALDKALQKISDYASFVNEDLALLIIDVDNLKVVNNRNGHQAGDELLRAVGQTLIKAFPRKDDFIARFGGDEFAIILSQTDKQTALRLAKRCLNLFRELIIPWNEETLGCTVSIGIANYDRKETVESCLSRADAALYQAKNAGRNALAYHPGNAG